MTKRRECCGTCRNGIMFKRRDDDNRGFGACAAIIDDEMPLRRVHRGDWCNHWKREWSLIARDIKRAIGTVTP